MTDGAQPYASFAQRAGAELIDNLITFVPFLFLAEVTDSAYVSFFGTLTFGQLYNGVLDGVRGQTVGKRVVGIHVRDADDHDRTVGIGRGGTRAALVTCIQLLGVLVGYLGLLVVVDGLSSLRHERRQTWHDRLAGTVVLAGSVAPVGTSE